MIQPDKRLLACADMVSGKGTVCDVGTDHAYLPAYLVSSGICRNAIASDIGENPLKYAHKNLEKLGLLDKITLIQSDGLENIPCDNVSDVIIAGMGGETICGIIGNSEWIKNDVNIILQPMTKAPLLREWLWKNKFEIIREIAVEDGKFIYTIIQAVYSGVSYQPNDIEKYTGRLDLNNQTAKAYALRQSEKFFSIADNLYKSGNIEQSERYSDIAKEIKLMTRIKGVKKMTTVNSIYEILDRTAPFKYQEKWDNSGLIVGDGDSEVNKILIALDITNSVVDEACRKGSDLIISHHPIIFHPLKKIDFNNPVCRLLQEFKSAICIHTPFDVAKGGINDILYDMLKKPLMLEDDAETIEAVSPDGVTGYGKICSTMLSENFDEKEIAAILKDIFGCTVVRYCEGTRYIKRIAFCGGAGGSFLDKVIEMNADVYITGDVKHDQWITASNNGLALFDCGHYHTETIALDYLKRVIQANCPDVKVEIAESNIDPVCYKF